MDSLSGADFTGPATFGAGSPSHLLLEGGRHRLLRLLSEVDALDAADSAPQHVLYDVVPDAGLVGVYASYGSLVVLEALHVADDGAVACFGAIIIS